MTVTAHEVDIEVVKIIEMSTCHITKEDSEILKKNVDTGPENHPQIVMEYEHGFMVSTWHNGKDNPEKFEDLLLAAGHSPAYVNLCSVAHKAGCKWLNLDCDASDYSWLPSYEW